MSEIKVLHTSNLHLGCRFPGFDKDTENLRISDINRVFLRIKEYIIKKQVDLILVAGDLFDKMNPSRETISTALSTFGEIGRKLPQAKIVLTPGREEIFVPRAGESECNLSIFEHLANVEVIGVGESPESIVLEFEGGRVRVTSCLADLFFEKDFQRRKLQALKEDPGIFLLSTRRRRGSVLRIDDELLKNSVLAPIKERGYKYAALGGRHTFDLIESGEFTAIYPGSPERFDFDVDREKKCFVIFSIKDGEVQPPETVRTRARPLEYINITCTYSMSLSDIEASFSIVGGRGDKEKMLYIVLNGQLPFDQFEIFKNSERLKQLRDRFACLHIENRLILLDNDREYNFEALCVNTPIEEFRNTVEAEIKEANGQGEEVRILKELLEMGMEEIEDGP